MKPPVSFAYAALFLVAHTASAATVTLSGNSVDFTYDDALVSLFGTPTVLDDTIYFTPADFDVTSLNGAGLSFTNALVNISVAPKAGFDLDSVTLFERGTYLLLGPGAKWVEASGLVSAFDLADPGVFSSATLVSTPTTTTGLPPNYWDATAGISLDTATWQAGGGINLTIENFLIASTVAPGSMAYMDKAYIGASFVASPVPEPDDYLLMLASIGLIGFVVAHRSNGQ
ncbi:hypothetical protein [Thiobacillus sp.]|uniref:hypothetical protein n=1 Tax=Thiobacillus sp. TaxID=924 RepID=UPI00286E2255|nr:hypothetical protein [Thiobacillus sp.]